MVLGDGCCANAPAYYITQRLGVDTLEETEVVEALRRRGMSVPTLSVSTPQLEAGSTTTTTTTTTTVSTHDVEDGDAGANTAVDEAAQPPHLHAFDGGMAGAGSVVVDDADGQDGTAAVSTIMQDRLSVWLDLAHVQGVPVSLLLHLRTFVSPEDGELARNTTSNAREAIRALQDFRSGHAEP